MANMSHCSIIPAWTIGYVRILNAFDRGELNCAEAKKALDELSMQESARSKGYAHIEKNRKKISEPTRNLQPD